MAYDFEERVASSLERIVGLIHTTGMPDTRDRIARAVELLESKKSVATAEDFSAAIVEGGFVELAADLTISTPIAVEKDFVLNLNGHKIESGEKRVFNILGKAVISNGSFVGAGKGTEPVMMVREGASLVMNNVSVENTLHTIVTNGNDNNVSIYLNNCTLKGQTYFPAGGHYVINGGEYVGKEVALYFKSGLIEINGGKFQALQSNGKWAHYNNGYFEVGDAVVFEACNYANRGNPEIRISGGEFIPATPAEGAAYKNYGLMVIDWNGNTANVKGISVPYQYAQVKCHVSASGKAPSDGWYYFNDSNTEAR